MDEGQRARADEFVRLVSHEVSRGGRDVEALPAWVHERDHVGGGFRQQPVALFARSEESGGTTELLLEHAALPQGTRQTETKHDEERDHRRDDRAVALDLRLPWGEDVVL